MNDSQASTPAWILCRNLHQFALEDDAALLRWARQGRVQASDYLVSTRQDTCVQAKDLGEVGAILRAKAWQERKAVVRRVAVFASVIFSALLALTSMGCSVSTFAVNRLGDAMARGGTTWAADDDPQLVGEALPFSLKLMESLLSGSPHHRELLVAAARGFTQYSYGWVAPSDDSESGVRSRRLYLRARDYGLRALAVSIPDVQRRLRLDPRTALAPARESDVPALYWTAVAWGLAIAGAKDDPEMLADLPAVDALISRAAALDPDFEHGAIDQFLIRYEASHASVSSGADRRAREHFRRAVALTGGLSAEPYVAAAEALSVPGQDRAEFESLLACALAVDVNTRPEWRLANIISQRRAAWLLEHAGDLFVVSEGEEKHP